jgi:phosphatidylinositol alpha-1,6-mannosyltransferase
MLAGLAREMAPWLLTVVAPDETGAAAFDRDAPYRVERARAGRGSTRGRRFLATVAARTVRTALSRRPQVFLCGHALLSPLGPLLKRTLGIPYCLFAYDIEFRTARLRPFLRPVFAHSERVVTISRYSARLIEALGCPRDRVRQIPLGYDAGRLEDASLGRPRAEMPLTERLGLVGKPWILTVARLDDRYKGVDMMLRALPGIAAAVPGVRYVVAGDGRTRPELERLASDIGCRSRVSFLGRVNDAELASLYAECSLFALMSRDRPQDGGAEGFGLVFLEAGSFGRPVLGGNSGGIPDAVRDGVTGLLADPENVEEIAAKATRLLTDAPLAERLGRQGRARVLHDCTWSAAATRLKEVLGEIVQ